MPSEVARSSLSFGCWASVLVAIATYAAMATNGVASKSGTFDEVAHVTAGYTYWAYNDYRLNPENGNWPQRLEALPLVVTRTSFPSLEQTAWRESDMWTLGDEFLFRAGNDADSLLRRARIMVTLVGALLALLVFSWSRHLFGAPGAWVSLLLFAFSPTMLAHGALATSDLIGTAFFTAAVWALWNVLHRITPLRVIASTVATAGLFLSKLSAPILVPIAVGMVVVRLAASRPLSVKWRNHEFEIRGRFRQGSAFLGLFMIHVVVVLFLIWASYGFRYRAMAQTTERDDFIDPWPELLADSSTATRLAQWGRDHHVLPEAYLYGMSSVMAYSKNRVAFLNGEVTTSGGYRSFFPYAALVKTTLPALLLLAAIPILLAWRWRESAGESSPRARIRSGLYELTPLLLLIAVYWAFAISSTLNIGHRHLLPVIPAAIVLAGAAGYPISRALRSATDATSPRSGRLRQVLGGTDKRTRTAVAVVALLLMWHAFESVRIAPHYLAYFNPFDGGPKQAYRHLVDSSLDWGQDLPALKDWLDREGLQASNHPPVFLSYFGTSRPEYYGIDAKPLPGYFDRSTPRVPEPLTGGVYCISATMLQGLYLMARGKWSAEHEEKYQATLHNLRILDGTGSSESDRAALLRQTGEDFWVKVFHALEQLRFARLAAHLRSREPDAHVGFSILIYRLSDQEVSRALFGPTP
jgi:hypothetical protein